MTDDDFAGVLVFAPSPQVTVTIEDLGGEPDLHVHAGGQGVWQARMIASLGVPVVLCAALGGETGDVLRHLIERDGISLVAVPVSARNGGYVHDRRGDGRVPLAEAAGDPLPRHDLDSLYEAALLHGLRARTVLLSGPSLGRTVPTDAYRRLAADLRADGRAVLADLAGERLDAVLEAGLDFLKVSHEELLADGRATADDPKSLVAAMRELVARGARSVLVSCGGDPALALLDDELYEVRPPVLHPVDTRGAGDSMTAAVAATLTEGGSLTDAVRLGAAAGALNVTRHGLGTSGGHGARELASRVELRRIDAE
ncbi:1-phosphofructokinase [Amycolatopsis arida]|uniref:1-phosphofructokinase n=1 Tax=Amycolatopsis arida TaxID=587909 RepID=A0A1I5XHY1_9PSEU|nr:PfkB family carbohydrate kinase [Amycolatopsis arida]TDX97437.1 1-phosphofructokinase [Amycolatopsis arida]SFQ31583.1 1-phosphofructokinase [Amycolatopsis arida]